MFRATSISVLVPLTEAFSITTPTPLTSQSTVSLTASNITTTSSTPSADAQGSTEASTGSPVAARAPPNDSSGPESSLASSPMITAAPYKPATTAFPVTLSTIISAPTSSSELGPAGKAEVTGLMNVNDPGSYGDTQSADPSLVHRLSATEVLAAVIITLVLISISAAFAFLYLRRRRRRRRRRGLQTAILSEREMRPDDDFSSACYDVRPRTRSPAPSPSPAQPVMLSSVSPMMNSACHTGIDTSDAVPMPEARCSTSGSRYYTENGEEPPPTYRPRRIAPPVSRDPSLRQAQPATLSRTHLIAHDARLEHEGRNHCANPQDEDAVSNISGPTDGYYGRNNDETMSEVADLSCQKDPTTVHHTI